MDMKIGQWGEENLIEYLSTHFPATPPLTGIGDDCAVIPLNNEMAWLVTTDALVENVHFLTSEITPKELGNKSIAVNVSDIAAMGGKPESVFLSIALPVSTQIKWVKELIEGIRESCTKWNIRLLGGDTVESKSDIFINVTLMGTAKKTAVKYRHQAQLGDILCTTGRLGNAAGGLKALQEMITKTEDVEVLIESLFHPKIYLEEGQWLGAQRNVHAMMDISDGLDTDLKRLLKSSKKGATLDVSKIPLSEALQEVSRVNGWDALNLALSGGEDYSLLFTASPETFETLQKEYEERFQTSLYPLGVITEPSCGLIYQLHGKEIKMKLSPFEHFHQR